MIFLISAGSRVAGGFAGIEGAAKYYAGPEMAKFGVPAALHVPFVAIATLLELGGAILYILGNDLGAQLLLAFIVPVTLFVRTSALDKQDNQITLLKDIALTGALIGAAFPDAPAPAAATRKTK